MSNPLQHIEDAKKQVAARNAQRNSTALEHRGAIAAEAIADELTMIRAEMSAMRELLALIQVKIKP